MDFAEYQWDPAKSAQNLRKHGVRFADVALLLEDPFGLSIPDPDSLGESRFVGLGTDPAGRILVTVYTLRGHCMRIISSRAAGRAERRNSEAKSR